MSPHYLLKVVAPSLLIATNVLAQVGGTLAPANDINFPAGVASTLQPLNYAGANSPWFKGPDVYNIPYEVPEGCTVQQAAYTVRHGSRFPDSGAHTSWVALQAKIQAAVAQPGFSATGTLKFIPDWQTVLTNKTLQVAQESMTGFKEAHDLGYQLRTRYPKFYQDGNDYLVWANQYAAPISASRVVQTAQAFLQGYLYVFADTYGKVVAVNSTGATDALGDSLAPSDMCPAFTNNNGNNVTNFHSTWVPDALARINSLVTGNLTFTQSDLLFFPYLCGYESQITGRLSPWCGVFNDTELLNYQYSQDVSYFYGVGPGSDGAATKVFLPYMDELMSLLMEGPGQQGTGPNGTFTVPNLIMSFLNDNQIVELASVLGIFEDDKLPIDHYPGAHPFDISHFISMRGTVAFEVLNCSPSAPKPSSSASFSSSITGSTIPKPTSVSGSPTSVAGVTSTGHSNSTAIIGTPTGTIPTAGQSDTATISPRSSNSATISTITVTESASNCAATPVATATPARKFKRATPTNEIYIRIILNDAVYPVTTCQSGPGNSCLLSDYASFIHAKNEAAGDFVEYCNVTAPGHETSVPNGASFYTDLSLDYLTFVKP